MIRLSAACAGLVLFAAPALADPPRHESLAALDQVMIERSAEARCVKTDAAVAASFQRHYRRITDQAALTLKELSSDLTRDRVEKLLSDHYSVIDRRMDAVIAQESCDSAPIKEALQKYDSVANSLDTQLLANTNN